MYCPLIYIMFSSNCVTRSPEKVTSRLLILISEMFDRRRNWRQICVVYILVGV